MAAGSNAVDLCFMMDCTGSMGSWIEACKRDISRTVGTVVAAHPDATINLGFVAYRDHCDGSNRIQKFGFEKDVGSFQAFVGSLSATGGGDYPEDVLGGLWESANMAWTSPTRVLFHIFDAPPHGNPKYHDSSGDSFPDGHPSDCAPSVIFSMLRDNFVDYYMCKLSNALEKMVRVFIAEARAVDYENVEERPDVSDVSRVMEDVADAVLSSMSVMLSTKPRHARRADAILHPTPMANMYKVYCGIDFGTHGSAFAFCTHGDPHPISFNNWSGRGVDVKTLTNLCLGPNKKCVPGANGFGDAALDYYLDLEPEEQRAHYFFRRFKMALYQDSIEEDDRKTDVDISNSIVAANGKSVRSTVVLEEALKFMVNHVMRQIGERYDVTDKGEVQWILTVPAIWSQRSRRVMERAARAAGIPRGRHDQLIVALEPECASVIAQETLHMRDGECYMLVDCGGGTVDIACHELVSGTEVREIYKASGGPWGATYIDDEWMRFLETVFGGRVMDRVREEVKEEEPGLIESIIKDFNGAKATALPSMESHNVNIAKLKPILREVLGSVADVNAHLERANYHGIVGGMKYNRRGMLSLSWAIWDELFGKVIRPMIAHIRGLLARPDLGGRISTLCIVGGFAESPILMKQLTDAFGGDRRVVRPPNPILTVVKGAAKFGLNPTSICERSAAKTIGIAIRDAFNEATDPMGKRSFVRGRGYVVDGVFFPFICAGQGIPHDMAPVVHYFEPVSLEHFAIQIYQSDEENPRFVPDRGCGTIGPIEFPHDFDHNAFDICVQFDFSGRMVTVKVQFGEEEPRTVDIDWE